MGTGKRNLTRREFMKLAGSAGLGLTVGAPALAAAGQTHYLRAPRYQSGTTVRGLFEDNRYTQYLLQRLPEFTEQSGINVQLDLVSFPILLEQSEIEMASGASNYDTMQHIFIKAQRWMRAGWCHPLSDYISRDEFDIEDFLPAARESLSWEGVQYGVPFSAESTQMLYRTDKLEEAGLEVPQTFDDLENVLEAIHDAPDFSAYVMRTEPNGVHFQFPIWLQGFGGDVFLDPPNDLTPTLNTPEARDAMESFTSLITRFSVAGSQIYGTPDCQNAMARGLAGTWVDALSLFAPVLDPEASDTAEQLNVALPPGGPAGQFPQVASHGYQIPESAANKDAAWEFIKWATSPEIYTGAAVENGYSVVARASALSSPEYNERFNVGDTEIGALNIQAFEMAKIAYRVVPPFPEVGLRIGQAIGQIISGQRNVQDALDSLQQDAEQIVINAGFPVSS